MGTIKSYRLLKTVGLVSQCIEGDPYAWKEFIRRYSPLVEAALKTRLLNHNFLFKHTDIEDIKQIFFIKLWKNRSLEKIKGQSGIKRWVIMIAANSATDHFRRSKKDVLMNADELIDNLVADQHSNGMKDFGMPENIEARETKIETLFSGLSDKERVALKLAVFHRLKYRDIAGLLKLAPGTVSSLIKRARKKIKKLCNKTQFLA